MIHEIGAHRIGNGDVMTDIIERVMQGKKADIMNTDPPWGQGNIKYWETLNRKQNPGKGLEREPPLYEGFLNRIFEIAARHVSGLIFIAYGVRWRDDVIKRAETYGLNYQLNIPVVYSSKNLPLDLHILSTPGKIATFGSDYVRRVSGTKAYKTLQVAVLPFLKRGDIVLDPCCGMGYTAQLAIDCGGVFHGNELNTYRLKKTLNRLSK